MALWIVAVALSCNREISSLMLLAYRTEVRRCRQGRVEFISEPGPDRVQAIDDPTSRTGLSLQVLFLRWHCLKPCPGSFRCCRDNITRAFAAIGILFRQTVSHADRLTALAATAPRQRRSHAIARAALARSG